MKESPPAPRGRSRLAPTRSAVAGLQLREREPLDQLHHDRPGGVVLQAVDRGDVRVVEGGEGLRLAREPREALAIVEEAARQSMFQGLAASGWHTAAMTMRLLVDSDLRPAGGIVGLGFEEFRWPWPVRPGDELRVESEILDGRPSKTRPGQGIVKVRTTTLNQDGHVVQLSVGNLIVSRRPNRE